ncbi:hypothetical protein [Paenibacillus selenitireducens]|uniref:hypothetical protein n=1 Tax=Paenibacillus selenitireducens TaxID=1324314 RepID=UPI001301B1CF|nr:hypothetical protein [Paenibacillus selenitireducens]
MTVEHVEISGLQRIAPMVTSLLKILLTVGVPARDISEKEGCPILQFTSFRGFLLQ